MTRGAALTAFVRCMSVAAALAVAAACAVGPNYHRPKLDTSPDFKEAGAWKPSEPNDALNRGPWWEIYGDDVLSQLAVRIDISNQNVQAAAAAYDQARALVAQARAGFWPTVTASLTPRKDIEIFLNKLPKHVMVLIDEAYHHYVRPSSMYVSFLSEPLQDDRVIVCRTFSKVFGLAGLRVGYGVGAASTIARMAPHIMGMSVNSIAISAGLAALDDAKACSIPSK